VLRQCLADIFVNAIVFAHVARAAASMIASRCFIAVSIRFDGTGGVASSRVRMAILSCIAPLGSILGLRQIVIEAVVVRPQILERQTSAILRLQLSSKSTMLIARGVAIPAQILAIAIQVIARHRIAGIGVAIGHAEPPSRM
jgi:hypothetical protein